jgi:fumarylacetoacetase
MSLTSWKKVSPHSDFSIYNIPFGIYSDAEVKHRVCSAIGDEIIDLHELYQNGFFKNIPIENTSVFEQKYLNDFIALGKLTTSAIRHRIQELLSDANTELQSAHHLHSKIFKPIDKVKLLLPLRIGDYTDFYSSEYHATNVGKMFRDPNNALLPNWKHLPVGYHGRSSSIFVSPHSFYRPNGQTKPADAEKPIFGPSKLLDFELETAFVIGKATQQGDVIPVQQAREYIFGMLLFNDWSARDIQTWEYQPLGPFLAKNFASTISPWVVTMDALAPFYIDAPPQNPEPLPYLRQKPLQNLDIQLEVYLRTPDGSETLICQSNTKYLYWTMEQQLAHHTINGCPVNIGDLMASGTISGPEPHQFGSMLELTWKGTKPLQLNNGEERKFLQDGDTIIIKGFAEKDNIRVGFGTCEATVLPAKNLSF